MKRAFVLLWSALLAACSISGSRPADRYFVLEVPRAASAETVSSPRLSVLSTTAANFYDTQDIVYSRTPGTRAYYQFNHWTERPQRVLHALLASRLEAGGVGSTGRSTPGGLVLNTHLEEIYHDAAAVPGNARITITAQLVDPANRTFVARRTFTRIAPATSYDAAGAVNGFNQALGALVEDIAAWVRAQSEKRRN